jgi:hypothetical protein
MLTLYELQRYGVSIKEAAKSKKNIPKRKHYSWDFWFINILTLFAVLVGFGVSENNDQNSYVFSIIFGSRKCWR